METIKKIVTYIVAPFHRFGSRGSTERIVKFLSKHPNYNYLIAFIVTVIIIVLTYFI